ncbi:Ig-like domain-containing protein [Limnovirga soli]|uniref:T9SS type A sorting domain-containing protein n=1 Tax=Limnovirga soli TaxID=2656915 RepID=A0A8J8FFU2_9BACT|nr:T9SS type A sorting domain-containing protein [Limnovirga soli]NNV55867.1 T9SS type A sorting domain-containing protein [Limnovirga soli]
MRKKAFPGRRILWIVMWVCLLQLLAQYSQAQMRYLNLDTLKDNNSIKKFCFYTPNEGYIASQYWLGYTTDSGHTITKKYITISNVDYNGYAVNLTFGFGINGIKAFSKNNIVVYGHYGFVPAILTSTDGANTFKLIFLSLYSELAFNDGIKDMAFPENANTGYAVDADRILKTADKGNSWFTIRIEPESYFECLEPVDNNNVYTYNRQYGSVKLLKTSNAGSSWQQLNMPFGNRINSVSFITANTGWVNINEKLYKTINGGGNWSLVNDSAIAPFYCNKMKFINDTLGYAINGLFEVVKTTDGGKIWERLPRDNSYTYLYFIFEDLQCWDANLLWAGGGHGFMEISNNGGGKPIPKAYFTIDTANLYNTNTVHLNNYSKTGYTYEWYKNDTLISTDYNSSYQHDNPYQETDTIQLIVSNSSGKDTLIQYQVFTLPPPPPPPYTGWVQKQTNINDNLLDVRIIGTYGVMIGEKGIYTTTTGANNPNGWAKYTITGNNSDSLLLLHTSFKQLSFNDVVSIFYACGTDTVNKKAILLKIDLTNGSYAFLYKGEPGTAFNAMTYTTEYSFYKGNLLVVGNNGLCVNYNLENDQAITTVLEGNENLIGVFNRYFNALPTNIGVISANNLYVASRDFALAYTKKLNKTIKNAISGNSLYDYELADKKVFVTISDYSYYGIDSINRIKDTSIIYNTISDAQYGSQKFLATSKGVYKINTINGGNLNGYETIELQPGSAGKFINKIWFKQNPAYDTGYAVGKNGVLLATDNYGGPTVPYADILTGGNCQGDYSYLAGVHGTGYICKWYIDNKLVSEDCNINGVLIPDAGFHTLRYVVSNIYALADTSTKQIFISVPPATGLKIMVTDSVLCKSEPAFITIQNSESGYEYELIEESTGKSFGKIAGSGGTITLKSTPVSNTAIFYLLITSSNGGCAIKSDNRFKIIVEHTQSRFANEQINIVEGEKLNFYQRSLEASHFDWQFNEDAGITSFNGANPKDISYPSSGQKTLTLISKSEAGCTDTLNSNAVFVYKKPMPDETCYIQNIDDSDFSYYPQSPVAFQKIQLSTNNNYFITGAGNNPLLKSRHGNTVQFKQSGISYLAKYSTDGVLKWYNYIKHGNISAVTEDKNGNIYITGSLLTRDYYYFNNGDSMHIAALLGTDSTIDYYDKYNGFVLKMDSTGKYLWHSIFNDPSEINDYGYPSINGGSVNSLTIKDNNIILTGGFGSRLAYSRNGTSKTLYDFADSSGYYTGYYFVMKIDTDGNFIWSSALKHNTVNASELNSVAIDNNGNAYCSGYYEVALTLYNADGSQFGYLRGNTAYFRGFLLKYDVNGKIKWYNELKTGYIYGDATLRNVTVDNAGNVYATGSARGSYNDEQIVITSNNGTQAFDSLNTYLLIKFDTNGKYIWSAGSKGGYYGGGNYVLVKDNQVITLGAISNNGIPETTYAMTSANRTADFLTIGEAEFFVGTYSLDGQLKRIVKSGNGFGGHVNANSFQIDNSNNYIIGGVIDNYGGGTSNYSIFGNTLNTNGIDAFFTKTSPDFCASDIQPIANAGADKTVCGGSTVTLGTDSIPGSIYTWTSKPAGFSSSSPTPKITALDTTTFYLSVTNASGYFARDSVTIAIVGFAIADAGRDTIICAGQPLTIGTPATGGVYSWTSNPVGYSSSEASTTIKPDSTTIYYLSVSNGSCSATDSIQVIVNPSVEIVAINTLISTIKCENDGAQFQATVIPADAKIKWLNNGVEFFPTTPTDYTFLSTEPFNLNDEVSFIATPKPGSGCYTSAQKQSNIIKSTATPGVEISVAITASEKTICPGTPITFTAIPNNAGTEITYEWFLNGLTTGSTSDTFTSSTLNNNDEVLVRITSNLPCAAPNPANSNTIVVKVGTIDKPTATVIASDTVLCGKSLVTFSASCDASAFTTQWYKNGIPVATGNTFTTDALANNDKIYAVVIASTGCFSAFSDTSNTINITVKEPITPQVTIGTTTTNVCQGATVLFTATTSGGGSTPSFNWLINGISTGIITNTFSTTTLNNNDEIQMQLTSSETCTTLSTVTSNTITITVINPPPAFAGNNQLVCPGTLVQLGEAVNGNIYSWTSLPAGFTANNANPATKPLVTTNYILTVTNSNGCISKDTVQISTLTAPNADAGIDKSICGTPEHVLLGSTAVAGNTYSWSPATGLDNASISQPSALPGVTTLYTVSVTNSIGCSTTDTVKVSVNPAEIIINIDTTKNTCIGEGITIGITPQAGYTYNWNSIPAGFSSTIANPVVAPETNTTYILNQHNLQTGCNATAQVKIIADTCKPGIITIYPNPTFGSITIQLDVNNTEIKYFELIDAHGAVVLSKQLSYTTTFDLHSFSAGIYYYHVVVGFGKIVQSGKLILQH